MNNLAESLASMKEIIDSLSLDKEKREDFTQQYEKIVRRMNDPSFYLSTIGDFSSGKSTLINTLIQRKLLKVAHAATTAVPTYIRAGQTDHVSLIVQCGGKAFNLSSEPSAKKFEKRFSVELPEPLDERISLLTTDKELSAKIREVQIELPDDALVNNLCIIDTPGINPGADFAEKHAEITTHILNEKADAIVILFPADQAYTQSFEQFLKDHAEYFMKDAIFVVTMLDRVDEEEREDVIRFVKTNLRNNFHLKDPQVLSCSAMLAGKDPYWAEQFQAFKQSLMDKLTQNRQRIVTERLTKLSNDLLHSLQSEIITQKVAFENRLSVLQSHSVPNLLAVLADSKLAAFEEMQHIRSTHDTAIKKDGSTLGVRIMNKVNAGLNACDTRSGVTNYVKNSLASDIEAACSDLYALSSRHTQNLNTSLSNAISGMIEELKVYYGEIGGVMEESTTLAASDHQITIADKLTDLGSMIGDYEGNLDVATALGGAGLAAIIFAGLGPIGWFIGGFAALIGGDRLFLDSTRGKVRDAVQSKLSNITASVRESLLTGMKKNYNKAKKTLEARKNELIGQYKPVYEELEKQFQEEEQMLTDQIQHSEEMQYRIKNILEQLNEA